MRIVGVFAILLSSAAMVLAAEEPFVDSWKIGGKISGDTTSVATGQVLCGLVYLRDPPGESICSQRHFELKIEGENFSVVPAPKAPKATTQLHRGERAVVAAYALGSLAFSEPFEINSSPLSAEKLSLNFPKPENRVVRVRIIDPVSKEPVANVKIDVRLSGESFPHHGLGHMKIAVGETRPDGTLLVEHLPTGTFELTDRETPGCLAVPDREWLDANVSISSQEPDVASAIPLEKLPTIYCVKSGKGMIWNRLVNGAGFVVKGTELKFTAKTADINSVDWNPQLAFNVVVADEGLVKTPVVPAGRYSVISTKGPEYKDEVEVFGMGSIFIVNSKPKK